LFINVLWASSFIFFFTQDIRMFSFSGLTNLFGSSTAQNQLKFNGKNALKNGQTVAKNAAKGAIVTTTECAKQLQILGEQLRGVAKLIDDNTPAVTQVTKAFVEDVKSTQTGKAALSMAASGTNQKGGRRGSVFSNAAITGGVRRYLKAASRTLKQLGGGATAVGQELPSAATQAAKILKQAVNETVTKRAVEEATGATQEVVAAANVASNKTNATLGGAVLPSVAVTQVPEPVEVVSAANQTAASILKAALKAENNAAQKGGYKRSMKGGFFNLFKSSKTTRKSGKKGKKGGFFTFTPFNPNAPSGQFEGFAAAPKASASSLRGESTRGSQVTTQTSVGRTRRG